MAFIETFISYVVSSASIRDRAGTNEGTGNVGTAGIAPSGAREQHTPVGRSTTPNNPTIYRALLLPERPPTTFYRVRSATLWLRTTTSALHVTKGASPSITVKRLTAAWTPTNRAEAAWSAAHSVIVAPASTVTGQAIKAHPNTAGKWISVDITALYDAWLPVTTLGSGGTPGLAQSFYGLLVTATDESTTTGTIEYDGPGVSGGTRPYISLEVEPSAPPRKPIISSPLTGDAGVAAKSGSPDAKSLIVVGVADDPDPGQPVPTEQVQVFGDAVTDGSASYVPPEQDVTFTGQPNAFSLTLPSVLVPRATYRHRVRSYDGRAWGPWTSLTDGRFTTVYQPGVPSAPYFSPFGTSGNVLYASLAGVDAADYVTAYEAEVYEDPPTGGAILKWASGEQSVGGVSQRAAVPYGGSQLQLGRVYRWRIRLANVDGIWSPWTAWQYVALIEVTGPDSLTPIDTSVKQLSRTPVLTVGHSATFDGYQVRLYSETGETLYDSGLVTVSGSVTLLTSAAADDILDATAHGFVAGDKVAFTALTGGAGLVLGTWYHVIAANLAANTFQVSATPGGAAVNFTTDITAGTVARRSAQFTVPTGLLDWGDEPKWEAAIRLAGDGELGPFSPQTPFRIDSLPASSTIAVTA